MFLGGVEILAGSSFLVPISGELGLRCELLFEIVEI